MGEPFFFLKVQNYPLQKYWIHQFNILLCSLCFVSLLPVAFYSWPQVFHADPALLYPILPCIIPLIAWYFVDSACREEENLVFWFGAQFISTLNFTQSGWLILFSPDLHFRLAKRVSGQTQSLWLETATRTDVPLFRPYLAMLFC